MTTVALRSSLGVLGAALLQLGGSNKNTRENNNSSHTTNNILNHNNKRTLLGSRNNNKHVHFQLVETSSSDEAEDEEDDNDKENRNQRMTYYCQQGASESSSKRQRKAIFIYVTSGVKGGQKGKKALMAKFRHAVQIDSRSMEVVLPEWRDVPSPLDITCGVSDDLDEKHTRALMAQGVLMVKSSWMLHCITDKRLLVPINEERFALRPNHPVWTKEEQTRPPLIRVTEASYYSSTVDVSTNSSRDLHLPSWKQYQDDVIRVIHQAKVRGQFDRAKQFENLLKSSGKTDEEIQAREKHFFGWSAELLKF